MKIKVHLKEVAFLYLGIECEKGGLLSVALIKAANTAAFDAWSDIKPVLRDLIDITYEETIEYKKVIGDQYSYIEDPFEYEEWYEPHIEMITGEPHVLLWLVNKGFDIFGLIDSGQAVKRVKL